VRNFLKKIDPDIFPILFANEKSLLLVDSKCCLVGSTPVALVLGQRRSTYKNLRNGDNVALLAQINPCFDCRIQLQSRDASAVSDFACYGDLRFEEHYLSTWYRYRGEHYCDKQRTECKRVNL